MLKSFAVISVFKIATCHALFYHWTEHYGNGMRVTVFPAQWNTIQRGWGIPMLVKIGQIISVVLCCMPAERRQFVCCIVFRRSFPIPMTVSCDNVISIISHKCIFPFSIKIEEDESFAENRNKLRAGEKISCNNVGE